MLLAFPKTAWHFVTGYYHDWRLAAAKDEPFALHLLAKPATCSSGMSVTRQSLCTVSAVPNCQHASEGR